MGRKEDTQVPNVSQFYHNDETITEKKKKKKHHNCTFFYYFNFTVLNSQSLQVTFRRTLCSLVGNYFVTRHMYDQIKYLEKELMLFEGIKSPFGSVVRQLAAKVQLLKCLVTLIARLWQLSNFFSQLLLHSYSFYSTTAAA